MEPDAALEPARRPRPVTHRTRAGREPRLSGEEMLLVARLSRQGRSAAAISRLLTTEQRPISPQTIAEWLRRARQPAEDLHMALASLRLDAVESWSLAMKRGARDGRHAPAKDLLVATGTVDRDQGHGLTIVIGQGLEVHPQLPARGPRQVLDAELVAAPAPPQLPPRP